MEESPAAWPLQVFPIKQSPTDRFQKDGAESTACSTKSSKNYAHTETKKDASSRQTPPDRPDDGDGVEEVM